MKIKKLPVIILAVIVAALLTGGVSCAVIQNNRKKEQESKVQVSLNQTNLKNESTTVPAPAEKTTVEILLDNTAVPVGTVIQVTALVTPANTENALTWSSSNESVFTVTSEGVVTITGTGTAALTATIGTVADAVAIEGIATVTAGSVNSYPVYTGSTGNNSITGGTGSGAGVGTSTGSGSGITGGSGSSAETGTLVGSSSGVTGGSGSSVGAGASGGTDSEVTGNSGSSTGGGSGDAGASDGPASDDSGDSGAGTGQTGSDTGLETTLPEYGFTQTMSNVYVCVENGTYYGQIITQPNVTIIYIKQRSSGFDASINNVLTQLLPDGHAQVWSNYVSAATDRTFTVEGRRVRIVAAVGGGHSQIVIYN